MSDDDIAREDAVQASMNIKPGGAVKRLYLRDFAPMGHDKPAAHR